ncbi:MAG TPA: serine/threonine-protein kinase, partial [Polyangiaceae bacterium]|nr:serine/threonine-protein kinase [Polyangiaceae bacterium]
MADDADDRTASLVGTVLGRYSVGRLLGQGGMGVVYEATHRELGRRVAIKTMRESYAASSESRQRFLREGKAAAQIQHANVADVFDVAIEEGCPYLVMEYLEGEDLACLVAREAPLSIERTSDIVMPVVAALAAAHDRGIVHRDLKPQNIFLARERTGVVPKVLDFGISKLAEAEPTATLTGTGAVLGTPHYMSPEQARGGEVVDARSDQYSLGVVLYQCVTGRRPLQGVPLYSLIQRTVHGDFPPPRQVLPALPSAFEEVILRAMARDPERRFPSTRALGQALLPFVSEGLRAAYAAELGGADISPASAPRKPAVLADALSSTLGESAHARPVTGARPRGSFGWLVGALLLVVGTIAWRFAQSSSTASTAALPSTVPAASTPPEASASATRALRPSLANDVPSGA